MSLAVARRKTIDWRRAGDTLSRDEFVALVVVGALTLGAFLLRLSQMHQSLFGDELWTYQQVTGRSLTGLRTFPA